MKKLKITACTLSDSGKLSKGSDTFEVMLNSQEYTTSKQIKYRRNRTPGNIGSDSKFQYMQPMTYEFKFLIDGSGAIRKEDGTPYDSVHDQLKKLKGITFKYKGSSHAPNYLYIVWSDLSFYGVTTDFSTKYILFTPEGKPLRAEVTLKISEFFSKEEEVNLKNQQSPDMTHIIHTKAGDTLPLLCNRIYNDSSYYMEVAKFNNLMNFRKLKPGTKLLFPPLQ